MLGPAKGIVALGLILATGAITPAWAEGRSGTTERVSVGPRGTQAQGDSGVLQSATSISADGRFVAFESLATNLVPGDTNGVTYVFVRAR